MSGPYGSAALAYSDAGWAGVLPLPARKKTPPPGGYTGHNGTDPDGDQIQRWIAENGNRNLALRVSDGVIGIDVDDYGSKQGGETIAVAELQWAVLAATWRSSSRPDDPVSGIRYYRVPPGIKFRGKVALSADGSAVATDEDETSDIEIVQHHHRYAVAPPSIHPEGRTYGWIRPDGTPRGPGESLPRPDELPELPPEWIEALRAPERASRPRTTDRAHSSVGVLTAGQACSTVRRALAEATANCVGGSRHDHVLEDVGRLLRLGEQGHPGVDAALAALRGSFVAAVGPDREGGSQEADAEFDRMVEGGELIVARDPTPESERGCRCGTKGGEIRHASPPLVESDPATNEPDYLPEFPLEYLPAPLAELSSHLAGIWNVDPALYAVPGLAVLSAAIGNTVSVALPGGQSAPALLWLAIVARTGSGKTPAAAIVRRPLLAAQEPLDATYLENLDIWKRLPKSERDRTPRPVLQQVIVTDSTWESVVQSLHHNRGGVIWWRDEVLAIFKQLVAFHQTGGAYGSDDNLSAWSQDPIRRQRVKDGEISIVNNPYLPIYGGIQPARVGDLGTNDGGRLARLLCYQTERWPSLEGQEPDEHKIDMWGNLIADLISGRLYGGRHRVLRLDDQAKDAWREYQHDRTARLREADPETADYLAKLDQHAGRLVVNIHTAEHTKDDDRALVDSFTIDRGWALASVFLEHQLATYRPTVSDFVVNPIQRALDESTMRLDAWVRKHGGKARRRDAQKSHVGGARNPSDFAVLVERWTAMGLGHEETEESDHGKPAVWLVMGPETTP